MSDVRPNRDIDPELPHHYTGSTIDWTIIPNYMIGGLRRYIELGIKPGDFLTALLCNDLRETFGRADDYNARHVREYMVFLYNYAPSPCWGSPGNFRAWIERGGLVGKEVS